ncbi:uncharacterized protein [Venturia canescens]|uniref:uncharacterized protein isoform X2 n=1 Tax=Venturia canescens TaxID=32260 RepID=UPI001C9CD49B|nr:uncharacterized protein LOC122415463 isoform X2 [Venturia canescens]
MANIRLTQNIDDEEEELKRDRMSDLQRRLTKAKMSCNMFEGISETELYHGLRLVASTALVGTLEEICYCSETKEYLVLEIGTMVHRYSMQGKPIRPPYALGSTMLFTKMVWCSAPKIFACYIPHDDMVWLINTSCKLLQILRNEFRIENIFYSSVANQIVVVGTNKLTRQN